MKHPVIKLLVSWTVLAFGVALAAKIVPGISYNNDLATLFWVVVLLSFFNAILRPVLLLFTLPFIVLTMGIGIVLINALLFLWVGLLVNGFEVQIRAALLGSLIVSATNIVLHSFLKKADQRRGTPPGPPRKKPDDVIDI